MPKNIDQTPLPEAGAKREEAITLIRDGLMTLEEAELQELDEIITPRAAELLVKAFGPEMQSVLAPLVENDAENDAKDAAPPQQADENALRGLIASPEYWRERKPQTVRKVAEGFRALYGG